MLIDSECKNATCTPDKKRERFTDGGGLYLEVSPAGSKRWFWKTYADGKEGRMALGSYLPQPPEKTVKVEVKLADGKARQIQSMASTSFWSADGTPMSAAQFLENLYGVLPEFFKNEDELRTSWSSPVASYQCNL